MGQGALVAAREIVPLARVCMAWTNTSGMDDLRHSDLTGMADLPREGIIRSIGCCSWSPPSVADRHTGGT
jgi:hypothetical protein